MNSIWVLASIVAVLSRIFTQEAILIELQSWAKAQQLKPSFLRRKLTYPLQCQFCFSVWVAFALSIYLFFHQPFDLVWLSLADAAIILVLTSTAVLAGIANLYLIAYELLTLFVRRTREQSIILAAQSEAAKIELRHLEFHDKRRQIAEVQQGYIDTESN